MTQLQIKLDLNYNIMTAHENLNGNAEFSP